jgi:predicted methyltransferase
LVLFFKKELLSCFCLASLGGAAAISWGRACRIWDFAGIWGDTLDGECLMRLVAVSVAVIGWLAVVPGVRAQGVPAYVSASVDSPDRPKADTDRDALRHPGELITFAGMKPGERVADIMPGKGYFTRLFSKVVGPKGRVYAIVPVELAPFAKKNKAALTALTHETGLSNVTLAVRPVGDLATPQPLDVAWTSDNYHDLYGFVGAAQAAQLDSGVFKALKPGGVFIVIDHVAKTGTSDTSAKTLHRIDPATVKAQVLAAGFKLDAESPMLANPADPHDAVIFSPAIRGKTDQFVMRFLKPG